MARKRKTGKSRKLKKTPNDIKFKNNSTKETQIINENNNVVNQSRIPQNFKKVKEPIVAPNGKTFYPCQYCTKIFPRDTTCRSHMVKCSNKNKEIQSRNEPKMEETVVNNMPTIENTAPMVEVKCKEIYEDPMTGPEKTPVNEKQIYPCKFCSKIFRKETSNLAHMKKCLKKQAKSQVYDGEKISKKVNAPKTEEISQIQNDSSLENRGSQKTDEDMEVQIIEKETPKYDISVYDYDEDTTEEVKNKDCQCKICPFVAENPIELLKHKRSEHTVPKKIVSPSEIQKYFDYPDRSYCPLCEKPLKTRNYKSIFVKHLLVHTAGFLYECRICKKKFRRSDHLRTHEKRHIITFAELQAIQDAVYEDDA